MCSSDLPTPSATSPVTGISSTPANTGSVSGVSNSKGFGNSPSPSSHPYKGFSPSMNRSPRSGSPSTFGSQSTPTMPASRHSRSRLASKSTRRTRTRRSIHRRGKSFIRMRAWRRTITKSFRIRYTRYRTSICWSTRYSCYRRSSRRSRKIGRAHV